MTETEIVTRVFGDDPSGRFQVLGAGELPVPSACGACGSGDSERKFVFLGVHFDFHGALILCNMCIVQIAELVGCMAPIIAERIHLQAVELAEQNVTLRRENEAYSERLAVFDTAIRSVVSNNPDPSGNFSDATGAPVTVIELPPEAAPEISDESKSESTESSEGDGSSEPSRTASSDITAKPRVVRRRSNTPSI